MEPLKVVLEVPVMHGSEEVKELTFREPIAKDMRDLSPNMKVGDFMDLASKLSNQPPSVINNLKLKDLQKVLEVVQSFL